MYLFWLFLIRICCLIDTKTEAKIVVLSYITDTSGLNQEIIAHSITFNTFEV